MYFMRYPGGLGKALTFSYDDGVEQDINLIRILDKYGMKGTFNINSGEYAPEGHTYPKGQIHRRMSRTQCMEVYKNSGHEVAVHCLTHASLIELPRATIVQEVMQDRLNLEKDYGGIIRGCAYPFGTFNDQVVEVLRDCGILFARTVMSTHRFDIPQDWLRLPATCHHDDPMLMQLADKFANMKTPFGSQLFYVWGHSYEFEEKNNWQVIEDFCAKLAGKDDIWYATNSEVFAYLEAWRKLIPSADGLTLHNPTTTPLWLTTKGQVLCIAPGETKNIG